MYLSSLRIHIALDLCVIYPFQLFLFFCQCWWHCKIFIFIVILYHLFNHRIIRLWCALLDRTCFWALLVVQISVSFDTNVVSSIFLNIYLHLGLAESYVDQSICSNNLSSGDTFPSSICLFLMVRYFYLLWFWLVFPPFWNLVGYVLCL